MRVAFLLLIWFSFTVTLLVSCSKKNDNTNIQNNITHPTACFTIDHNSVAVMQTVSFTDCSQNATSLAWDFGDGSPAQTGSVVTHGYTTFGTYTVSLTASKDTARNVVQHQVVVNMDITGQYIGEDSTFSYPSGAFAGHGSGFAMTVAVSGSTATITSLDSYQTYSNGTLMVDTIFINEVQGSHTFKGTAVFGRGSNNRIAMDLAVDMYYNGTKDSYYRYHGLK